MVTLEAILESANLNQAWKRVVANKGSAGVDGMEVGDLRAHLFEQGPELVQSIKAGKYKPQPVSTHSEGGKREIQTTGHPDSD